MEECDFVTEINESILYKNINRIHKIRKTELLRKREQFSKGVAISAIRVIILALIRKEC